LELQAFLDSATEVELLGIKELLERGSSRNSRGSIGSMGSIGSEHDVAEFNRAHKKEQDLANAAMKFTYVVACQIYGAQKARKDVQAADILQLMKTYSGLRVAYVDEITVQKNGRDVKEHYSVLVKFDPTLQMEVEIYRIQLPGPLKLGEGKPENQNHALIFTRGDAVQTIDMNQVQARNPFSKIAFAVCCYLLEEASLVLQWYIFLPLIISTSKGCLLLSLVT
jgi:callose synthase